VAAHCTRQHIPQPLRADTHDFSAASSDDELPELIQQRAAQSPEPTGRNPDT
jgi:hypothetical protein